MAQRYFGNTLTDLQNALTARDRLAAEQNIASQGNMVRFTQGTQQAMAQQAAAQQQNQLAREQMAQSGFFNQGRLRNDEARIAAELEAAKANAAATADWRKASLQPRVDAEAANKAADAQAAALLATQSENLAKARTEHERLTADLAKLTAMELAQTEQQKLPEAPGTFGAFFGRGRGSNPPPYRPQATTGDGRAIGGVNFAGARQRLQQQLDTLTEYIKDNGELNTTLTKQPDGSWASTLRPILGTNAPSFFGAPNTQAVTNAPATFFNAAPPNREALIQKITEDFRAGRIDRATAEQGLRALGLQ